MTVEPTGLKRLTTFLAGSWWWMILAIQVLLIVGVTISELDIGVKMGSDETADVAMAAVPPVGEERNTIESAAAGAAGAADEVSAVGAALFASNCASCHGEAGQGGIGPALAGRSLGSSAVSSVVESGQGLMPSFGSTLSSDEIAAVAAYVSGLGTETAGSDPEAGTDEAAGDGDGAGAAAGGSVSGAAVFASNCASCHGGSGQGGIGPALAGRSLGGGTVRSVVGSGRGLMPSFASTLSSDEISAVAAYVSRLGGGSASAATAGETAGSAGGSTAGEATGSPTGGGTAGGSVSGASVFASNCASCHGGSGQGGIGPALAGRSLGSGTVSSVVGSGRGLMPSFASTLSSDEIAAVAAYVSGLGAGSSPATTTGAPAPGEAAGSGPGTTTGDAAGSPTGGGTAGGSVSGASVFASNCASCHGGSGEGGIGPTLSGRSLATTTVSSVVGSGRGLMPSFASRLSSDEIAAVAAYVSGLGTGSTPGTGSSPGTGTDPPPPPPRPSGPAETFSFFCAACHGADGRGTAVAPYILDRGDKVFRTVRRGDDPMPSFSADLISDAELRAVADYIASLDPDNDDDEDRSGSNSGSG